MGFFDPLMAAWRFGCPQSGEQVWAPLASFRRIERLAGPACPPAYQIRFMCGQCDDEHTALLTEHELDVAPVLQPVGAHHDLMLGRMDWQADGVAGLWELALRAHRWPLVLRCPRERAPVGAWPSVLHAIEPVSAEGGYLVHYRCPRCERRGFEQWPLERLTLTAALG